MELKPFTRANVNDLIYKRFQESQSVDRGEVEKASKLVIRLMRQGAPLEEIRNAAGLHAELCDRFNGKYPAYGNEVVNINRRQPILLTHTGEGQMLP